MDDKFCTGYFRFIKKNYPDLSDLIIDNCMEKIFIRVNTIMLCLADSKEMKKHVAEIKKAKSAKQKIMLKEMLLSTMLKKNKKMYLNMNGGTIEFLGEISAKNIKGTLGNATIKKSELIGTKNAILYLDKYPKFEEIKPKSKKMKGGGIDND